MPAKADKKHIGSVAASRKLRDDGLRTVRNSRATAKPPSPPLPPVAPQPPSPFKSAGGHRVTDSEAAHALACGDDDAGKIETKNDGGRPSHEIKVGQLVFEWVERRGGNADQHLVGCRLRDGNTHRFKWESGPAP